MEHVALPAPEVQCASRAVVANSKESDFSDAGSERGVREYTFRAITELAKLHEDFHGECLWLKPMDERLALAEKMRASSSPKS